MNEQSENSDLKKLFESYTYPVEDSNWEAISVGMPAGTGSGFLGDTFADYTLIPSQKVWTWIEAVLLPSSKNRIAAWWWYGAAASLLFITYLGYISFNSQPDQSPFAQEKVKTENHSSKTDNLQTNNSKSIVASSDTSRSSLIPFSKKENDLKAGQTKLSKAQKEIENSEIEKSAPIISALLPPTEGQTQKKSTENNSSKRSENKTDYPIAEIGVAYENESLSLVSNETAGNVKMVKMKLLNPEVQLYTAQPELERQLAEVAPISDSDQKKLKSSPFYDGTQTKTLNEISLLAGSQLAFGGNTNQDSYAMGIASSVPSYDLTQQSGSTEYSTPVSYGVNGEIKFWNRFSAGTGLGYLQMKKTSDYYTGENRIQAENERRYLTIPVYLKFNFINKPKFAAYTSLGNSYEFLIWQKTTSETYTNGQLSSTESTNAGEKGNQANTYAGLGMHFKFTRHFGVFAEGSIMRYYKLSDTNFFNQQNLWPGLKFGALVSF